ncbi:hypothetical protein CJ010_23935 [Azoarcus sp. DD4]|uniref:hydrogenase n=1 Tax=Azoarcus sp. DD4 TaxID=2027405 RepID=UPI0011287D15|nr:hydrogenase [Azoarcus sp. DD4]QDF99369.1 hypothetical protein CJ010_23935 [Azoarcus sp. DD4]
MTTATALEQGMQRLVERDGFRRVTTDTLVDFARAADIGVLLLTDDPVRCPEAWDMLVVLPEVLKSVPGLRAGVAAPDASRDIAATFGISRYPALLFLRGDDNAGGNHDYVGAIEGMRDWQPLVEAVAAMRHAPAGRRPGIGIPVRGTGASSTCH